jgi:hypothetical protein
MTDLASLAARISNVCVDADQSLDLAKMLGWELHAASALGSGFDAMLSSTPMEILREHYTEPCIERTWMVVYGRGSDLNSAIIAALGKGIYNRAKAAADVAAWLELFGARS